MAGAVDLGGLKNGVRRLLIVILDDRQTVGIEDMGQERNQPGIRQMIGWGPIRSLQSSSVFSPSDRDISTFFRYISTGMKKFTVHPHKARMNREGNLL